MGIFWTFLEIQQIVIICQVTYTEEFMMELQKFLH